jgi:hypothetical protein
LTHYCGRAWDLLRTPVFVEAYRRALMLSEPVDDLAGALLASCFTAITTLVNEGIERGEFAATSPKATARLLVSSLFARAHWCGEGFDPLLSGSCSRVVVETLDLVWPALAISACGSRPPAPADAQASTE